MENNIRIPLPLTPPPVRVIKEGVGIAPPKSVYCVDCKWFGHLDSLYGSYKNVRCFHPSLIEYKQHPILRIVLSEKVTNWSVTHHPKNRNMNLDCKDYERKWWKFWR